MDVGIQNLRTAEDVTTCPAQAPVTVKTARHSSSAANCKQQYLQEATLATYRRRVTKTCDGLNFIEKYRRLHSSISVGIENLRAAEAHIFNVDSCLAKPCNHKDRTTSIPPAPTFPRIQKRNSRNFPTFNCHVVSSTTKHIKPEVFSAS